MKPLKRPNEQKTFGELLENKLSGKDSKRKDSKPSKKQKKMLAKSSVASSGESRYKGKLKPTKPPKYPQKKEKSTPKKGILRRNALIVENSQESKSKEDSEPVDDNDIQHIMNSKLSEQRDDFDNNSNFDHRVSLRDISDNDSLNSDDGKFLPTNYVSEKDRKIFENKNKFKYGIRKRNEPLEDEVTQENIDLKRRIIVEKKEIKPILLPPKQPLEIFEKEIDNFYEYQNEEEHKSSRISQKSLKKIGQKSQIDSTDYYAESESLKKPSIKESAIIDSELSIRDAADDNISASGSEMASPEVNMNKIASNKKTVTFQKGQGTTPSSSDEKEDDHDLLMNLATFKDHTNLSKFYETRTGNIYSKPPNPQKISYIENMNKLNQLYKKIKYQQMSPSDLILSNVYTEFLFHRNLITDKAERMKIDLIFKNAFKGIEVNKNDRIMISAQDDQNDILPVMDPLEYLDRKKEQIKNIEIEDRDADRIEGFHKGQLIPLAYDRDEDEDDRIKIEEAKAAQEFPDLNIGISVEEKLKEEAKQAKVRELQGAGIGKVRPQPESTLEEKLSEMNQIKLFNRQVEEAILKRDNLLKLVIKKEKEKEIVQMTGEKDYDEYDVDKINDIIQAAKNEKELKNLKDYEAIRILQKVLPESTDNAVDLPSAVSHFLNNPFEFLVYENPEAIPEEVRENIIRDNKNLLLNDEKYVREINILENQQNFNKAFNKNILYDEYIHRRNEADLAIDKDFLSKFMKLKKKRKKWYPEEIQNKRMIEQLEYEKMMEEKEESEIIDYNQGDVLNDQEEQDKTEEVDPEEEKRKLEEEEQRKVKPDHFKAALLSKAGEGTDDINYLMKQKVDENKFIEEDHGRVIGEVMFNNKIADEDYYQFLQKNVERNYEITQFN